MSEFKESVKGSVSRLSISPVGLPAVVCVFTGALLGVAVHMGFFALLALGAFGPGVLRELGLLRDLDECQKEAALHAGHRSYLTVGVILTVIVIARQWGTLRLGEDLIPASSILSLLLVVFGISYSLNFWDVRTAASAVLLACGGCWLLFIFLSHPSEPVTVLVEGGLVALPFLLGALLCSRWPRPVGLLLLGVAGFAIYQFDLYKFSPAEKAFHSLFVGTLLVLPLAALGAALLRYRDSSS